MINLFQIIKIGLIAVILLISLIFFHIIVGFLGLQYYFGSIMGIFLIIMCFLLKFFIPISIATFFGALNVIEWHWIPSLLISLPGIIFLKPSFLTKNVQFYSSNKSKKNYSNKNYERTFKTNVKNTEIIDGEYKVINDKKENDKD